MCELNLLSGTLVKSTRSLIENSPFCADSDRKGNSSSNQVSFFIKTSFSLSFLRVKKQFDSTKRYWDCYFSKEEGGWLVLRYEDQADLHRMCRKCRTTKVKQFILF